MLLFRARTTPTTVRKKTPSNMQVHAHACIKYATNGVPSNCPRWCSQLAKSAPFHPKRILHHTCVLRNATLSSSTSCLGEASTVPARSSALTFVLPTTKELKLISVVMPNAKSMSMALGGKGFPGCQPISVSVHRYCSPCHVRNGAETMYTVRGI